MKLKVLVLLTAALFSGAGQAFAELPKDSVFRLRDCVPTDDKSLKDMKALRDDVRAAFARQGGAASTGAWADSWHWAWDRADDWTPISGDAGVVGLDSKTANMAAFIPRGWTGSVDKGYDPVEDIEASRTRLAGWGETAFAGFAMRHPRDWWVRVSSAAELTRVGGMWASLSVRDEGAPNLWLAAWRPDAQNRDSERFSASVGREVLAGYRYLGRDRIAMNGRSCRVAYLEGEYGSAASPSYRWRTLLGCGFADDPEDLHIIVESSEYASAGRGDAAVVAGYENIVRALCTILMVPAL